MGELLEGTGLERPGSALQSTGGSPVPSVVRAQEGGEPPWTHCLAEQGRASPPSQLPSHHLGPAPLSSLPGKANL